MNKRPFGYLAYLMKVRDFIITYLTYLMKIRDLKTANYKTINVWDQEYNKDVVSPQGFVFVTIFMCVSYLTCHTRYRY